MYTGKPVTMNVGFAIQQHEGRKKNWERKEQEKKRSGIGGHFDLSSKECKIWDSCWLVLARSSAKDNL